MNMNMDMDMHMHMNMACMCMCLCLCLWCTLIVLRFEFSSKCVICGMSHMGRRVRATLCVQCALLLTFMFSVLFSTKKSKHRLLLYKVYRLLSHLLTSIVHDAR